jgi:hypothetical protein
MAFFVLAADSACTIAPAIEFSLHDCVIVTEKSAYLWAYL